MPLLTCSPLPIRSRSGFAASLLTVALLAAVGPAASAGNTDARSDWWSADVWADPDRPFLFYGEEKDEKPIRPIPAEIPEKTSDQRSDEDPTVVIQVPGSTGPEAESLKDAAKPVTGIVIQTDASVSREADPTDPDDFSRFKTMAQLRSERTARLEAAVMQPTPENMRRYQAINAHMLALSARFAEAWQLGRFTNPQYDWTASHPSANFVTAALADSRREARTQTLTGLSGDIGILFAAEPGHPLTPLAGAALSTFAREHGLDVLAVAVGSGFTGTKPGSSLEGFAAFDEVRSDDGRMAALGVTQFPAVVLIPKPEALAVRADFSLMRGTLRGRDGIVIATGAVSGEELSRRIALLLDAGRRQAEENPAINVAGSPTQFPTDRPAVSRPNTGLQSEIAGLRAALSAEVGPSELTETPAKVPSRSAFGGSFQGVTPTGFSALTPIR